MPVPLAARKRGRPAVARDGQIPVPIGGTNVLDLANALPETDCLFLYNMVGAEYGLRSRLGWTEHATGLSGSGTGNNAVRSILPFTGSTSAKDRLFATTSDGIYDVTSSGAVGAKKITFGTKDSRSGRGISHAFGNSAGDRFLLYCDESNGYHVYTESTDTWAKVTQGAGATQIASPADPTKFVFVTVWGSRVWFVERDSSVAWYLATDSLYGTATKFNFGYKFKSGGYLVGLHSWTMDGGSGSQNSLVALSAGGDVSIYQGTDPSQAASFALKGVWSVGAVPAGRRIATDYGGDVLILSTTGIVPLSKLVQGNPIFDRSQYATAKVGSIFNQLAQSALSTWGWDLRLHPEDNTLLVIIPTGETTASEQLAMSMTTRGWARYRDLPIFSMEAWRGKLYFGMVDGRVACNTGYVDGVTLADPTTYTAVQWAVLTGFRNLGNARLKQVQTIRPVLLSRSTAPTWTAAARYGFRFDELDPVSAPSAPPSGWDYARWDVDAWGGDYAPTNLQSAVIGSMGLGVDVAIAIRGTANDRTVLAGIHVTWTEGGLF